MNKHTILVVDDDRLISGTMSKQFANSQVDVQVANSPAEAKDLLAKFHPELVLLDLLLTRDDGAQGVIDYMKSDPSLENTPILVLTNMDKPELKRVMIGQGIKEYLIKGSLSLDDIYKKVMSYLEP